MHVILTTSPQPYQLRNHDIDNRDIHNHTVPRPSNRTRMRLTNPFTRVLVLTLALLSHTLSHTLSVPLTISIPSSPQLPNPGALAASTLATLTTLSATRAAHLTTSHTFRFRNVSAPGSYLLSIACATHFFPPLRVDVGADGAVQAWRTFRGSEWASKGEEVPVVRNTVEIRALGPKGYYMERQGCEWFSLFSPSFSFSGVARAVSGRMEQAVVPSGLIAVL